ncbi:hypothetical protein EYZ11_008523 [Aspergillus tanneri]|uniref:Carrier domain-containing protein n=1 Tax=Aspergillus tanneri TaxID=1220188 RepID=A0A4V3UNQ4_9EURO|nr:uncharacterized protein ATNIH1004_002867 [Aspergillus tanneri]KAA8650186.1 hypothetical protein ATNIH1004_002867 [Aspergillus tanneri]THC92024.1 hypothetical protein EYZ11_008523 [Aspergillus tanneri]
MVESVRFLSYVGGSLPEAVGDALSTQVKLISVMCTCETLLFPLEVPDSPADWQYVTISRFFGHIFRPDRDGLSELVLVRQPDYEQFQGAFYTFPERQEYAFSYLFAQHPHHPESWVFRARTDDIIAFTTAEKLNPIAMESVIVASPKIKSAVIRGQGQFQASLLIEPYIYPTTPAEERFIQDIQSSRDCPAHGRIMKGFVMLTKPDKPLPRAGKDTVQRHAVFKLYAEEFQALYDRMRPHVESETSTIASPQPLAKGASSAVIPSTSLDQQIEEALDRLLPSAIEKAVHVMLTRLLSGLNGATTTSSNPAVPSPTTVKKSIKNGIHSGPNDLKKLIYNQLSENLDTERLNDDSDLFQFGLDSLQVVELVKMLNAYLEEWRPNVDRLERKAVYNNPTVNGVVSLMM